MESGAVLASSLLIAAPRGAGPGGSMAAPDATADEPGASSGAVCWFFWRRDLTTKARMAVTNKMATTDVAKLTPMTTADDQPVRAIETRAMPGPPASLMRAARRMHADAQRMGPPKIIVQLPAVSSQVDPVQPALHVQLPPIPGSHTPWMEQAPQSAHVGPKRPGSQREQSSPAKYGSHWHWPSRPGSQVPWASQTAHGEHSGP